MTAKNPIVAEICTQLDAADGMVDDTIVFVLRYATAKIHAEAEQFGAAHDSGWHAAADVINPDRGY